MPKKKNKGSFSRNGNAVFGGSGHSVTSKKKNVGEKQTKPKKRKVKDLVKMTGNL